MISRHWSMAGWSRWVSRHWLENGGARPFHVSSLPRMGRGGTGSGPFLAGRQSFSCPGLASDPCQNHDPAPRLPCTRRPGPHGPISNRAPGLAGDASTRHYPNAGNRWIFFDPPTDAEGLGRAPGMRQSDEGYPQRQRNCGPELSRGLRATPARRDALGAAPGPEPACVDGPSCRSRTRICFMHLNIVQRGSICGLRARRNCDSRCGVEAADALVCRGAAAAVFRTERYGLLACPRAGRRLAAQSSGAVTKSRRAWEAARHTAFVCIRRSAASLARPPSGAQTARKPNGRIGDNSQGPGVVWRFQKSASFLPRKSHNGGTLQPKPPLESGSCLVSFDSEVRKRGLPQHDANFGIGEH